MSQNILKHIGFIMDGNGRWAEAQGKNRSQGHKAGLNALTELILDISKDNELQEATFYCFSTENWNRPKLEVQFLMALLSDLIDEKLEELRENKIQVNIKGDLSKKSPFDNSLRDKLVETNAMQIENPVLRVNLCLNYGGQDEIVRCANTLLEQNKTISIDSLNKEILEGSLPLDLVVRTSGEQRISNFLIWQIAYAELMFVNYHWPDINLDKFNNIKQNFCNRNRRFGAIV